MQYRMLGKTGLRVSEIGFGGEWLERHEEEESVELMRYAKDAVTNGSFRDISVPHGRMDSMCEPET